MGCRCWKGTSLIPSWISFRTRVKPRDPSQLQKLVSTGVRINQLSDSPLHSLFACLPHESQSCILNRSGPLKWFPGPEQRLALAFLVVVSA